ncbi:hypothetical protein MOX02_56500 [Methylobacterium oxalidis]|uniref:Integration host factor subunit beta n=1 Tax=Methylobacterium oxalidis TaxID=944322 RepID=A0A512JCD9_9HYPH|nr:hypothetical protein MOX02_56500 [Methylobacterium oxalidis]GJE33457.1 Integration host factor subunit beta [Methylobacterium oxalidis]GLS66196.1 hypothetical protein GCM10007888_45780 [Methylobacterium oxalidis]
MNAIVGRIEEALAAGNRVEIRGFGAFSTKNMRAREGRNPRTGERVVVTEKRAPTSASGHSFCSSVRPCVTHPQS